MSLTPTATPHHTLPVLHIPCLFKACASTLAEGDYSALKDKYLRALAEIQNVRKRAENDVRIAIKYGTESLLSEITDIDDSLRRALDRKSGAEELHNGVSTAHRMLTGILHRNGVSRHEPSPGDRYNAEFERITAAISPETTKFNPGEIVFVERAGYVLNERSLQPAMVGVVKNL